MLICLTAEADEAEDEGETDDEAVDADAAVVEVDLGGSVVLAPLLLFCSQDSLALGVDSAAAFLLLGARCFGWLAIWGSSLGGGSGGGGGLLALLLLLLPPSGVNGSDRRRQQTCCSAAAA